MEKSILDVLASGDWVIGDGGLGTMLQAAGLPAGTLPEQWNADRPEILKTVHRTYLEAGAQIITTNTFGGNRPRLNDAGLADRLVELNRLGVELAVEAVEGCAWIGGSVGPTGQMLQPYGTLSVEEAEAIYAEQVVVLAEAGADIILVETQHDIEEATAAIRMAKAHTDLPISCGFAFNAKGRTMMGLKPEVALARCIEAGADIVGANCGDGPAAIAAALKAMAGADVPLLAQSNAGIPAMGENAQTEWDVTPEQMVEHVREFMALGARFIGGCCGTGPAHIAAIAALK